jgi:uncharacterized membrane protein YeaQ/YmgE (transglycosylase-associated protein family)
VLGARISWAVRDQNSCDERPGKWVRLLRQVGVPVPRRRSVDQAGPTDTSERAGTAEDRRQNGMGIIGWIILGLLAGAIAKAILPGDDPGGIIVTMLIGIAGAIVGGLIASALDIGDLDEFFDIGTWLIAIAGSLLLLVLYRVVTGNRGSGANRRSGV